MKHTHKQILLWTPRILSMLFALFVSLFALDVFGEGYGFWGTLEALLIHLLPVFLLLVGLAIAWRWEWVGAITFISFSIWYIVSFWGRFDWSVYAIMAGGPLFVGILFGIDSLYHQELHSL